MIARVPFKIQDFSQYRDVIQSALSTPLAKVFLQQISRLFPGFVPALNAILDLVTWFLETGSTNSSNSSLPPSLDPGSARATEEKAKAKEAREQAEARKRGEPHQKKRPGGQPGHRGTTLVRIEDPDEIRDVYPPSIPPGAVLDNVRSCQVHELVTKRIVIEYRFHFFKDAKTGTIYSPPIPPGVRLGTAQYGPGVMASVAELNVLQMIPYARICQHLAQEGITLSEGSVYNFLHRMAETLRRHAFEEWLSGKLLSSDVMNTDDTPVTFEKKMAFVHICRSGQYVWCFFHKKRGHEAHEAMGILPAFQGTLVSDCYPGYKRYQCQHSWCHAHLNRELEGVLSREGYPWATLFLNFFAKLHKHVSQNGPLSQEEYNQKVRHYRSLLTRGWNSMDVELPPEPLKESRRNTKSVNLLIRLETHMEGWLMWAVDANVPYTNNDSERSLRMIKVREKVSNCFRSEQAARDWCLIRSFVLTSQLHGITNVRELFANLVRDTLPDYIGPPVSSDSPLKKPTNVNGVA